MYKQHEWIKGQHQYWSNSNYKFMAPTTRVTPESLHNLDGPRRDLQDVADAIIMASCCILALGLLAYALFDKAGWIN